MDSVENLVLGEKDGFNSFCRKKKACGEICRKNKIIKIYMKAKKPLFHPKCGNIGVVHTDFCENVDKVAVENVKNLAKKLFKTRNPL